MQLSGLQIADEVYLFIWGHEGWGEARYSPGSPSFQPPPRPGPPPCCPKANFGKHGSTVCARNHTAVITNSSAGCHLPRPHQLNSPLSHPEPTPLGRPPPRGCPPPPHPAAPSSTASPHQGACVSRKTFHCRRRFTRCLSRRLSFILSFLAVTFPLGCFA